MTQVYIFCLEPLSILLHAKFGFSAFVRHGDMEGSKDLESRSRDPGHAPSDPNLHFCLVPPGSFYVPNLVSLALRVLEI